MLVLSRRKNETIVIDGCVQIEVLQIKGNEIRLGIQAPAAVKILRGELTPFACQNTPQELSPQELSPQKLMPQKLAPQNLTSRGLASKKASAKSMRSAKALLPIEFASDEEFDSIRDSLMESSVGIPIDAELPGIRINGRRVTNGRSTLESRQVDLEGGKFGPGVIDSGRGTRSVGSVGRRQAIASQSSVVEDAEDLGSGRIKIRRSLERMRAQSNPALRALTFKIDVPLTAEISDTAEEVAS